MSSDRSRSPWQQPNLLGQTPKNFYAIILLGFRLTEGKSIEDVKVTVQDALERLSERFPFLAGRVHVEGKTLSSSGTYKVVPYDGSRRQLPLRVEDLSEQMNTFDALASANAPMSMLAAEALAPFKGLPKKYDPLKEDCPILCVQLTMLSGGFTLTFCGQHNPIDMNGLTNLIHLFAKASRGESFTDTDMQGSRLDASSMIPLLPQDQQPLPHDEFRRPPQHANPKRPAPPPTSWRCYRFSKSNLIRLKQTASPADNTGWTSTNDALTAFIWQRVSGARQLRLGEQNTTKLLRMINGLSRANLDIPQTFMGTYGVPTLTASHTFASLSAFSLADLALALRRQVQSVDQQYMKSWATLISREQDKSTIDAGATIKPSSDMLISSWAENKLYGLDFGRYIGRPEFVRRPNMGPLEGLCYLMPRTLDGHIDIALSLLEEDWGSLEQDNEWQRCTEFIG